MPRSCTSCASQLLDHAVFCTTCGRAVSPPEPSTPGGAAGSDVSAMGNPANQAGEPGAGFQVQIASAIAVCGMLLAVIVGVGMTAIDYPLHGVIGARPSLPPVAASPIAAALPPPVSSPARVAPEASAPVAAGPSAAAALPKREAPPARVANARKGTGRTRAVAVAAGHRPAVTREAPSIDDSYQDLVRKECRSGIVGILCGESVRWRLCDGRWNNGDRPGETRCQVGRKGREGWDRINGGPG